MCDCAGAGNHKLPNPCDLLSSLRSIILQSDQRFCRLVLRWFGRRGRADRTCELGTGLVAIEAWSNPDTGAHGRGADVCGPYGGAGDVRVVESPTGTLRTRWRRHWAMLFGLCAGRRKAITRTG